MKRFRVVETTIISLGLLLALVVSPQAATPQSRSDNGDTHPLIGKTPLADPLHHSTDIK